MGIWSRASYTPALTHSGLQPANIAGMKNHTEIYMIKIKAAARENIRF